MTAGCCNVIACRGCPPVVCSTGGWVFEWWTGYRWARGDVLPPAIRAALPASELARCDRHAWRRLADNRRVFGISEVCDDIRASLQPRC